MTRTISKVLIPLAILAVAAACDTPVSPTGPAPGDAQFAQATDFQTSIRISAPSVPVGTEATITAQLIVDGHPLGGKRMILFIDGLAVDVARSTRLGTAVFKVSGLTAGTHSVSVEFPGDNSYFSSASSSSITITP